MPENITSPSEARERLRGHQEKDEPPLVLVVDDDQRLLAALRRGLALHGFQVETAGDAAQALGCLQKREANIIVLDIMMPGLDGLSLCSLVREKAEVPILMLTARDSVPDRVAGLQAGADDYVVKPFAFDELVARIEALLRRASFQEGPRSERLSYADIHLDRKGWAASRSGRALALTATEFRLLERFLRASEQVLTREDLLEAIWGEDSRFTESNVVDVHVANLRQKLESDGRARLIHTVRGVGYIMKEE